MQKLVHGTHDYLHTITTVLIASMQGEFDKEEEKRDGVKPILNFPTGRKEVEIFRRTKFESQIVVGPREYTKEDGRAK
jgi:hypothetical protein